MGSEEIIAIAKQCIKAINDRDWSFIPKIVSPNFIRHDLSGGFHEIRGQEGLADFLQLVIKALPDYQIKIEDAFATEDHLALRFTSTGTHQGDFLGYPATGKKVVINQINLYRFDGNKIAETWQLMDMAGFLRQIGALPLLH